MASLTVQTKQLQNSEKLLKMFCNDCKLRGMTEKSIVGYRSCLSIFLKFLEERTISPLKVNNHVLREFLNYLLNERRIKYKTVKEYFSALSAFYDYLAFEGLVESNFVLPFRKRYLRRYKDGFDDPQRRLLSVEEMSRLVNSIMDPRDKAIAVLLAKTGIRRGELLRIDVDDINWKDYSITLKPTPKRSNRIVFFDDECAIVLKRWLRVHPWDFRIAFGVLVVYLLFSAHLCIASFLQRRLWLFHQFFCRLYACVLFLPLLPCTFLISYAYVA